MVSRKIKLLQDWHPLFLDRLSAFVTKGRNQREHLLLKATEFSRDQPSVYGGIPLHIEGGYAYDRHARMLVERGLLKMERRGNRTSRWSVLVPTEKGFEEADRILRV
jgi:hypothetical protein